MSKNQSKSKKSQSKTHLKYKKINPQNQLKKQEQIKVKMNEKDLKEQEQKNEKGDTIFKQDQKGRDKTVEDLKAEGLLYFKVKHIGDEEVTESIFQEKPAILNRFSCYFTENNISYRDIIGGFELQRIHSNLNGENMHDYHLITANISKIKKVFLREDHFVGYCFYVNLANEQWTLCHKNKANIQHFRDHLRVQTIMSYLQKYHIHNPFFFQK